MACVVCNVPTATQCSKCHMVRYCCRDHQAQHFDTHKGRCKNYGSAVKKMEKEEAKLRRGVDGWMGGFYYPFDGTHDGQFWGLPETRDYMRARYQVVLTLDTIGTPEATLAALNHCKDCLRLCRSDNMGVRDHVVGYLVMLGRDQECYDFLKWYATMGNDSHYDWGNMSLPFLHLENENRYEPVLKQYYKEFGPSIPSYSAMILIKYRILGQLLRTRNGFTAFLMGTHARLGANSPVFKLAGNAGILTHICSYLFVEAAEDPIHVYDIIPPIIKTMKKQVSDLIIQAEKKNGNLFKAILNPRPVLEMASPEMFSAGSIEELQVCLRNLVRAWQSVQGAVDTIAKLRPRFVRKDVNVNDIDNPSSLSAAPPQVQYNFR